MRCQNTLITIDGPAGVGKGTVAKIVASELDFLYLDTGAMYRAFALAVKNDGIDIGDQNELSELIKNTRIEINSMDSEKFEIHLNSKDITDQIRSPEISSISSKIASIQLVRTFLVEQQREIAKGKNVVVEGRDMGTYVFPYAKYKFYLDAQVEERAKRRYMQLSENNKNLKLDKVLEDIKYRDKNDTSRQESPLHPASNAVIIDTSNLTVSEVVGLILERINLD